MNSYIYKIVTIMIILNLKYSNTNNLRTTNLLTNKLTENIVNKIGHDFLKKWVKKEKIKRTLLNTDTKFSTFYVKQHLTSKEDFEIKEK